MALRLTGPATASAEHAESRGAATLPPAAVPPAGSPAGARDAAAGNAAALAWIVRDLYGLTWLDERHLLLAVRESLPPTRRLVVVDAVEGRVVWGRDAEALVEAWQLKGMRELAAATARRGDAR